MSKKEKIKLDEAKKLMSEIAKTKIVFEKEADEKNQLYGSISKKEIIDFLLSKKIKVKSDDLIINDPIKMLGEHEIEISPYIDISEKFKLLVNKK